MKVEILKVLKKGSKYLVTTNVDIETIIFSEDCIVKYYIFNHQQFNINEWNQIKEENQLLIIYNKVIKYIDYKPRTIYEVKKYLDKYHLDNEQCEYIINKLQQINYLNDNYYIDTYIDECIRKKMGPNKIINHLIILGIDSSLINDKIKIYDDTLQYNNAISLVDKNINNYSKYPMRKQKELISNKLYNNGYNHHIISQVINNLDLIDNSNEYLELEIEKLINKNINQSKIISLLIQKGYKYEDIIKVINK